MLRQLRKIFPVALFAVFGVMSCLFLVSTAQAAINPQINFQGKLTNPDGTNVTDGTYSIVFSIYSVSSGGTAVWTETQGSVSVTDGIFRVALGSITTLPGSVDFNSASLYLGVKVGADAEMTPRIQLTASPYAFNSDKLGGLDKTGFVQLGQGTQTESSTSVASISINKTGATADILQLQRAGADVFKVANDGSTLVKTDSATAFQVQNTSSVALFLVNASTSTLRMGDASNNVTLTAGTFEPLLSGTARHTKRVDLTPEYEGAVLTADGSANSGTMTTDFCSGSSRKSINTSICAATVEHNYYSWTSTSGDNDYDVYIKYQIPSDFAAFASTSTINMYGWRTDATNNKVELALFDDDGDQCGATTNVATGTAAWTETALGSVSGDVDCDGIIAGDIIVWRIKLTATAAEFARAGSIRFDYLTKY